MSASVAGVHIDRLGVCQSGAVELQRNVDRLGLHGRSLGATRAMAWGYTGADVSDRMAMMVAILWPVAWHQRLSSYIPVSLRFSRGDVAGAVTPGWEPQPARANR